MVAVPFFDRHSLTRGTPEWKKLDDDELSAQELLNPDFARFSKQRRSYCALKSACKILGLPRKAGKSPRTLAFGRAGPTRSSDLPRDPFGANFSNEKSGLKQCATLQQVRKNVNGLKGRKTDFLGDNFGRDWTLILLF